jgi:hypothetical protein
VALVDSGSVFTVTLSNSVGSVTSNPATLTVGARSPKPGDLRFKLVDYTQSLIGTASSNIIGTSAFFADNSLGSPLEVGSAPTDGPELATRVHLIHHDLLDYPDQITAGSVR